MSRSAARPPVHWTARALNGGALVSAGCLLIGLLLGLLGGSGAAQDPMRLDEVVGAALAGRPWGWSMLGVLVLLATPAAALLATYVELRQRRPRAALLALAVLAVQAVAVVLAVSAA
ncbi:MAG TPA: DUF1634 domain-containing protein [Candidatus Limnocylindria bacterium]|nr:DUF1634 domain-containing protein [Candidatus Limnocylindria bacterium]